MKYIPINFDIALQPLNWIIILLMLIIAGYALETVYNFAVTREASNSTEGVI